MSHLVCAVGLDIEGDDNGKRRRFTPSISSWCKSSIWQQTILQNITHPTKGHRIGTCIWLPIARVRHHLYNMFQIIYAFGVGYRMIGIYYSVRILLLVECGISSSSFRFSCLQKQCPDVEDGGRCWRGRRCGGARWDRHRRHAEGARPLLHTLPQLIFICAFSFISLLCIAFVFTEA